MLFRLGCAVAAGWLNFVFTPKIYRVFPVYFAKRLGYFYTTNKSYFMAAPEKFKIGDTVMLKSSSPAMTVTDIDRDDSDVMIVCRYWNHVSGQIVKIVVNQDAVNKSN